MDEVTLTSGDTSIEFRTTMLAWEKVHARGVIKVDKHLIRVSQQISVTHSKAMRKVLIDFLSREGWNETERLELLDILHGIEV